MFFSFLVAGCGKAAVDQPNDPVRYTSFRDIPGVTDDEVKAIEALREQFDHFVYGMIPSTESFYNDNGSFRGFAALFCEWLTNLFGIPFIPENTDVFDLLAKLASNEVDFTGVMTATNERREIYFMTTAIALHTVQYSRIVNSPSLESIAESRPLRYALMSGSSTIDLVTAKLTPGTYEIILTSGIDEVYRMLKSGEVDAVFHVNREIAYDGYGDVVSSDFFPLIYTSASLATQNPALEPVISVVQKALDNGALSYLVGLYNAGYQEYLKRKLFLQLSGEEHRYIQDRAVIPFAAETGNYPVSFYNSSEGQWQGIAFDVLREVESLTGLHFERVNDEHDDWPVLLKMLEDNRVSMITELMYSEERERNFLWPEVAIMTDNFALISRLDFRNVFLNEIMYLKVGLIKGYVATDLFREWFPDHSNTQEYENTLAAFDALGRGEVDVVMTTNHELLIMTNYLEQSGFKTNYIFAVPFNSTFGFNRNEAILCSIVNKALKMIDTKSISDHWMRRTYDYRRKILEARLPWLIGSSVLFFALLSMIAIFFIKNRRAGKRLEKLIEERTQELALQTSKLKAVFDSIPDIVFCKDLNLKYTQCNNASEEINGIKEADVIGKDDIETSLFPVSVAERIMEADRAMFREGRKTVTEETIMYRDGMRALETIRAPLVQDGVMIGLIVIARDITHHKMVEHELELQTATLTTLFDSIPDFIFAKDVNFCYMQCNKSYLAHLGFNREDVIGKNDIDGFKLDPVLVEEYWEADRKVISEGRKIMIEEHIPGVNGTNPLYETLKAPLVLDGEIIGLLGISHNITERKEMEDAALAASRSKSVFLANMSHEIRTPMNSIMGFSELALDGEASLKTREYLTKIQENANWLLQIINDILDISKIESGKLELEKIPFDIHELFESCRTLITPKAAEKGITMQFYAEPSIGKRPLGDPTRLRQVLVNLLSNAVKFTNSGTVKVLTEIREKSDKTVTFHFEIKDSGIGMTREQIERIFDPFIQGETGTTRKYGGTGLGLSITKNLILLMDGKLEVESTPGVGSKFSFDLTFDTMDISEYEKLDRKILLDELEKPVFDGEVLLCEDNAMNQQVISEHLTRIGLKVVVAENGKIGVEKVESRKRNDGKQFDLILMDIHMPVMDGLEAAGKIMELDTGIPIVAMTANIMSSDREVYKMSGMQDCIGKPFTSQELWRCLLKYLRPVKQASKDINTLQRNIKIEDDEKFQRELKVIFVRTNRGRYEEIENALRDEDITQANRLAHSLKTNAGQIGETSLQRAAAEAEQMLKEGKNLLTEEQLKKLKTELAIVLEKLGPLLEEAAAQTEKEKVPILEPEKIKGLFEKLRPLLEEANFKSMDYIDDLRGVAGSDGLIQQIEDFDFESAVVSLTELGKSLGRLLPD